MVNPKHRIDRRLLAAAAAMLVPGEHLFAEAGKMLSIGPITEGSNAGRDLGHI